MKNIISFFLIFMFSFSIALAQGTLRGKVTDENGESVIGVSVVLKSNPGYGVTSDLDGNFSLKIKDSISQTIIISFISYKTIEYNVHLVNNEVIVKNFTLSTD